MQLSVLFSSKENLNNDQTYKPKYLRIASWLFEFKIKI